MDKLKLIEILDGIQRDGNDFRDVEIYGMRIPDTVSNEDVADHLIANGVTVKQWIPVTERLPEKEGSYLVCSKTGKVYTSHYYTEKKCSGGYIRKPAWSHPNITHWMPLPEPPKEEA